MQIDAVLDKRAPLTNKVDNNFLQKHKISADEYLAIKKILLRAPTLAELGVFSALWSEHCSYKSSKVFLKNLPTTGEHVVVGPGENAGVIRIKDDLCIVFKMESHNHPSFLVPYHGAATGVGGILRDVFCMGARPIANINCLRFGSKDKYKNKWLCSEVVKGISDYGNCVGVPTVAGNICFDECYDGNCLVNVMSVGVIKEKDIFKGYASGPGNLVVYAGAQTGCDGIQGAAMASGSFSSKEQEDRGTIQVGDPFYEKLLIEATLEVLKKNLVVGLQDMGAAGLSSSAFEMAYRAGTGMDLYLDKVPTRGSSLSPYELLLSESQERMLLVVSKENYKTVQDIFSKWELSCSIVGKITKSNNIRGWYKDKLHIDIPVKEISEQAPYYQSKIKKREQKTQDNNFTQTCLKKIKDLGEFSCLDKILSHSGNPKPIYQQYDRSIGIRTILDSTHGGAAVLSLHFEDQKRSNIGIAIASSSCQRYCVIDPHLGSMHSVLKSARQLAACGAKPLAVTDCLNYGDPNDPNVIWELSQGVQGIKDACEFLKTPIVSGNVSLYNKTNSTNISPTPMIGMIGLVKDTTKVVASTIKKECEIYLLSAKNANPSFAGSLLVQALKIDPHQGKIAPLNMQAEQEAFDFLQRLHNNLDLHAARDVFSGGRLTCLYKMTSKHIFNIKVKQRENLFCESPGDYLIAIESPQKDKLLSFAKKLRHNQISNLAKVVLGKKRTLTIAEQTTDLTTIDNSYNNFVSFANGTF